MAITSEQFATIEHRLPKRFGNWHTIYARMNRWAKAGVLDRMFEELQRAQVVRIKVEAFRWTPRASRFTPTARGH